MYQTTMNATTIAQKEAELTGNSQRETSQQSNEDHANRTFGVADIWRIRRNAKTFRIHSRIPRL